MCVCVCVCVCTHTHTFYICEVVNVHVCTQNTFYSHFQAFPKYQNGCVHTTYPLCPIPTQGSLKVAPPPPQPPTDSPSRATHLNELLSHYLSPERLEGDNQYRCERCGKLQDGERTITIVECPQYLILTLLRFDYDTKTQTRSKVSSVHRERRVFHGTVHEAKVIKKFEFLM